MRTSFLTTLFAASMLAAPASAVVITNGTPLGTLGHFDVDVTSGGEVNSAQITATNASTAALQNSGNLIFDYFTYVRVGGTTYRLDNGTPAADGPDAVVSSGTIGSTGIAWSARSVLAAGSNRMVTTYDFESATGAPLGLQLFQYLDEDVLGAGSDVFFTRGSSATNDLELFTLDSTALFGVSHGGAYDSTQGLINATFIGWALCNFNQMKPAIGAGTQAVSITGEQAAGCTTSTTDIAELGGTVDGAYDIVSVLAWQTDQGSPAARIITTLGGVPDVNSVPTSSGGTTSGGTPTPEPASLMLLGAGLAGLAAVRRRR